MFRQRSPRLAIGFAIGMAAFGVHAADTSPAPAPARPAQPSAAAELDQARALIARKDWQAAIAQLQHAARSAPKNADVHNLLGYSYRNAGRIDDALREYEIALDLDPNHKGAHEYIGIAYLSAKQPDKARQHLASLERICGNTSCEEYRDLAEAIAAYKP